MQRDLADETPDEYLPPESYESLSDAGMPSAHPPGIR